MIAGAAAPSAGSVHFHATDVTALPMHRRARRGLARTFQLAKSSRP